MKMLKRHLFANINSGFTHRDCELASEQETSFASLEVSNQVTRWRNSLKDRLLFTTSLPVRVLILVLLEIFQVDCQIVVTNFYVKEKIIWN